MNQCYNLYRRLLSSLTHNFDALEATLGCVVTETQDGRADGQRGIGLLLSEFHEALPAESESPKFS